MDDDCPLTKACVAQECVDPCITSSCGRNAECKVQRHKAICVCPRGMQGNPLVACTEVGCRTNDDCADNEKCDYLNGVLGKRECQPLCRRNPCAQNAICKATGHQEVCECQPPYQGDGYTTCYKRKIITAKVFYRCFFTKQLFSFEYMQQDYQTLNQSAGLMRTVREIMLALVLFARTLAN